ncbi:MAG: hypothetical protein JXC85_03730 [Candidatus Aenigmarchaeota archaeon]|nr:hypothetical protein [Candidatus Aenigmarchaeota archaeon]
MTDSGVIELELPQARGDEPSWRRYGIIVFPRKHRDFFPGYKKRFVFNTDDGKVEAWVTAAASSDTSVGDQKAGAYICSPRRSERDSDKMSVTNWYRKHEELGPGDVLRIEQLNQKLYRLEIRSTDTPP